MNSEDVLLIAGPILRLLAVFVLGVAVLVLIRRKSPEWRVATVRATMMALPVALLLGFFKPAIVLPQPQFGNEPKSEEIQLPRKSDGLSIPSVGASLFPGEEKENAVTSVNGKSGFSFPSSLSLANWLLMIWALGFITMLFRELLGVLILRRRRSKAALAAPSLIRIWKSSIMDLGVDLPDNYILQLPDDSASPYLTPWPFTRLLIPSKLEERFSKAEIEHLFRHEAAHLAGRDPAALLMVRIIACSLWFFPGVWWLARKHLNLCEECADARAARVGGVESYREAIASFALEFVPSKSARVMALLKQATVVERLKVLSGNVSRSKPSWWQTALLVLLLFSVLAGIGRVGFAAVDDRHRLVELLPMVQKPVRSITVNPSGIDPSDIWYRGFLLVKKAQELEKEEGSEVEVINRLSEALALYKYLASDHPTFLPEIVTERTHLIHEKLSEMKRRLRTGPVLPRPTVHSSSIVAGAGSPNSGPPKWTSRHITSSDLAKPVLTIRSVARKPKDSGSQEKSITFVVEIASNLNQPIAAQEMSLAVYFYELVAGNHLEATTDQTAIRYLTEPYDWKDGESETIEIDYFPPGDKMPNTNREYYGKIFELYYEGTLQEVIATPSKLDRLVK